MGTDVNGNYLTILFVADGVALFTPKYENILLEDYEVWRCSKERPSTVGLK